MIQDAASPTLGQRILRSPVGPLMSRLSSERFFRQQFGSIFSPGHPLTDEEAEDQWALIRAGGGPDPEPQDDPLHGGALPLRGSLARSHSRLAEAPLARVGHARPGGDSGGPRRRAGAAPSAPVIRFEDLGHYPQIEDPRSRRVSPARRACRLSEAPRPARRTPALYCRASPGPSWPDPPRCGLIFRRIAGFLCGASNHETRRKRESWRARH